MPFQVENLPEAIREIKTKLPGGTCPPRNVFQEVESEMRGKVAQLVKEREAGEAVIPVLQYTDILPACVLGELARIQRL